MKLSVQINEGPYQHQATDTAYHFTKAALENGHEVMRVFFYHDGVLNGSLDDSTSRRSSHCESLG